MEKGVTLVEIIVVVFIIAIFSAILISDFPRILRQFALSRASYKLAQDFRRAEDLGLSGVQINYSEFGIDEINAKGYGIYVDLNENRQYVVYADRGETPDLKYDNKGFYCDNPEHPEDDCILEVISINENNSELLIAGIEDEAGASINAVSVNFTPPNPTTTITDNLAEQHANIKIILGSESDEGTRSVLANTSGLIQIK